MKTFRTLKRCFNGCCPSKCPEHNRTVAFAVAAFFVALALLNNSPDFDILFHAFAVCAVTAGINFVANETEMHFLGLTAAALVWLGVIVNDMRKEEGWKEEGWSLNKL